MRAALALLFFVAFTLAAPRDACAWIFPEHTRSAHRAFRLLSPATRDRLKADWQVCDTSAVAPQTPGQLHLCSNVETDPEEIGSRDHWCLGFAALPALAGDHSCSPGDLMNTLRAFDWVQRVLELSRKSGEKLEEAGSSIPKRLDARRDQHLTLQILDADYTRRAENNNAHFQLPRSAQRPGTGALTPTFTDTTFIDYVAAVTSSGHLANATAAYVYYHAVAIELAGEAARLRMLGAPYAYYAQWAFFNEAFALHFLQDAFSAGHFVGTWGDVAERLGTHDYYCQNGVDAQTWSGERYAARGDAFMSDAEGDRVAAAVAASLEQLGSAFAGVAFAPVGDPVTTSHQLNYDYEVCRSHFVPPSADVFATSASILSVLKTEPVPATESPALPRFRTELGFNVGVSVSFDAVMNAAVTTQQPLHGSGRARLGLPRIGLGVTDLLTRSEDGNWFLEGVIVGERGADGSLSGLGFRVHSPFAWIPLDGIPISLCALFIKAEWCVVNSRRAAAGSAYDINPSRRIGQFANVGLNIFRDFTLVWLNEGGLRGATRRDLLASLFTLRTGTDYAGRLATHIGLDVGFQWRHLYGSNETHYLGGYLSFFTDTNYYVAP